MARTTIAGLLLLLLFRTTPADAAPEFSGELKPFDFRGAQLGMSLPEFRSMPYPDNSPDLSAVLVCSGSPAINVENAISTFGDIFVGPLEVRAGIVKCTYFRAITTTKPGPTGGISVTWIRAAVVAGNSTGHFVYCFAPRKLGEEPSLYEISSNDIIIEGASGLVAGLTSRFGRPSSDLSDTVQARSGAIFPRRLVTWHRPDQTVGLIAPGSDLDSISLIYRNTRQYDEIQALLDSYIGPDASRL